MGRPLQSMFRRLSSRDILLRVAGSGLNRSLCVRKQLVFLASIHFPPWLGQGKVNLTPRGREKPQCGPYHVNFLEAKATAGHSGAWPHKERGYAASSLAKAPPET